MKKTALFFLNTSLQEIRGSIMPWRETVHTDTVQADLESPRECASICLISKRICTNLENWEVTSDYEFSLHLLSTLSLSFPKIYQKQHQKIHGKQQ